MEITSTSWLSNPGTLTHLALPGFPPNWVLWSHPQPENAISNSLTLCPPISVLTSIPILKFLNFSPNKCELPSGFVSHPGKSCSPFPPQLPAPQLSIATLLMTPTSFRTVPLSPTEHHSPTFPLSSHINLPRTSHIQPFQKQSHYLLLLGGSTT